MIEWLYYIYFTTNKINRNNRNIQLKLDENNFNYNKKIDENNNNNNIIFDELNFRLDKLISLNNKIP